MRSGAKNASRETSWRFQGKVRLAFVGALVVLVVGLCLVTLSGCSILPAHALGGSDAKDFQAEQSVQAVGGSYSDLSQAYQGICQKFSDTNNDGICDTCGSPYQDARQKCNDVNNDGICDNCGSPYQDARQKCNDANNDGLCDNCGNAYKGSSAGKGNSCQKGFARHCA